MGDVVHQCENEAKAEEGSGCFGHDGEGLEAFPHDRHTEPGSCSKYFADGANEYQRKGEAKADTYAVGKGKVETFELRKGFYAPGVISFVLGALVACMTGGTFATIPFLAFLNIPFFIGPINGIIVALVAYVVIAKAAGKKK